MGDEEGMNLSIEACEDIGQIVLFVAEMVRENDELVWLWESTAEYIALNFRPKQCA